MERRIYYKPDGAFKFSGLLSILLFSIPTVVVTSFVYIYLMKIIPFIYFNFLFCLGYSYIIGFAVSAGAKKGNIRNPLAALICAIVIGLLAVYVQWVVWFFVHSDYELLVFLPSQLKDLITFLIEENSINISRRGSSIDIKGSFLAAVYVIEGLAIISIPALFTKREIETTPYCSTCEKWVNDKVEIPFISRFAPSAAIRSQLEKGDFSNLLNASKCDPRTSEYLTVVLLKCPNCTNNNFLTLKHITVVAKGKKTENKTETILENLIIDSETYRTLLGTKDKLFAEQDNIPYWQNQNQNHMNQ